MKMGYRTAVSSLPKRVWGMHQPIYDDFPYLANHISNLRYAWNAQRRAAVAWLNLVNRWLTRVAQRSKCRLDWGLTLWLYHPSLLNKSWRLQLLDVLWACQDTTDGAPVIEKEAVQEFGCLDILLHPCYWFWNNSADRKTLLLHMPTKPLQSQTMNRDTSVIYGSSGSSVELLDTKMICQTINTYCVRLTSLCFARDVIGVHFCPRGTKALSAVY